MVIVIVIVMVVIVMMRMMVYDGDSDSDASGDGMSGDLGSVTWNHLFIKYYLVKSGYNNFPYLCVYQVRNNWRSPRSSRQHQGCACSR